MQPLSTQKLIDVWYDTKAYFAKKQAPEEKSVLYDITKLASLKEDEEEVEKVKDALDRLDLVGSLLEEKSDLINTKAVIEVADVDSFEMAQEYVQIRKLNPMVLNMASDFHPGGGVAKGAKAQEECLFRRSNAHLTHPRWWYGLKSTGCIYSPSVTVIKDKDYDMIKPFKVGMLAMAAIRNPELEGLEYKNQGDVQLMRAKINAIFQIAIEQGHDSLVLGALGTGAFNNPPGAVAKLFKRAVRRYKKKFKRIGFAVLVVKDTDHKNLIAMREAMANQ